jgi:hypothetical protein
MKATPIEELLDEMTLEEQVSLLTGADFWTTVPIPRLGVPAIKLTDGPNGARGGIFKDGPSTACFPVGYCAGRHLESGADRTGGRGAWRRGQAQRRTGTARAHRQPAAHGLQRPQFRVLL